MRCRGRRVFVVGAASVVRAQTSALDLARVGDSPDVWEKVVRRPRAGAMPPPAEQWITSVSAPVK